MLLVLQPVLAASSRSVAGCCGCVAAASSDQPAVVAAIRLAGGERDGTRQFWWIEARNLRT